jgi:signal transduction histidine kinase
MSSAQRVDLAHGLAHAMRSALTRAELAAGQLERDAATPRARRLAHSVSAAVAELDRLVSDVVGVLASQPRPAPSEDLRGVLSEMRQRYAPALRARGVEWIDSPDGDDVPRGNRALARRATALLLRVAAACAKEGGRIVIGVNADPDSWSVGIEVESHRDATDPPPDSLAELRALANRTHGAMDHRRSERWTTLRLRFPAEAAACPTS